MSDVSNDMSAVCPYGFRFLLYLYFPSKLLLPSKSDFCAYPERLKLFNARDDKINTSNRGEWELYITSWIMSEEKMAWLALKFSTMTR